MPVPEKIPIKTTIEKSVYRKDLQATIIKDHQYFFGLSTADVEMLTKFATLAYSTGDIIFDTQEIKRKKLKSVGMSVSEYDILMMAGKKCGALIKYVGCYSEYKLANQLIVPPMAKTVRKIIKGEYAPSKLLIETTITYHIID